MDECKYKETCMNYKHTNYACINNEYPTMTVTEDQVIIDEERKCFKHKGLADMFWNIFKHGIY